MTTIERENDLSVENYLAAEKLSDMRHEYLGGLVCKMEDVTRRHNEIALNTYCALREKLKRETCSLFVSQVLVNFEFMGEQSFYYPDLVVTCDKRDDHPRFIRFPKLIIEILSPSTERVDKREKFFAYTTMESLEEYVLVAQDTREVIVASRANEWRKETVSGLDAAVTLASLGCSLPLSAIYEGV